MRYSLLFILCLLPSLIRAQDPALDKLEMLYDQKHYKMVYRKSGRLMKDAEYGKNPLPVFYRSLSLYRLGENKKRHASDITEVLQLFDKFRKLDANGYYYDAHVHEIYELQMSVYDEIAALHTSGKEKDARTLYDRSAAVFRQKLDYESVVKIQKVTPRPDPKEMPEVAKGATRRDSIMQFAVQFVGVPYKWAGNDPSGFDCSGYTKYVMKNFGYDLYRIAGDQYYKNCKKIPFSEAQKGDLIFFGPSADKVTHVGIVYSEKGEPIRMIHAGSSTGITISDVENNSYWKPLMLFAGRLVEE